MAFVYIVASPGPMPRKRYKTRPHTYLGCGHSYDQRKRPNKSEGLCPVCMWEATHFNDSSGMVLQGLYMVAGNGISRIYSASELHRAIIDEEFRIGTVFESNRGDGEYGIFYRLDWDPDANDYLMMEVEHEHNT